MRLYSGVVSRIVHERIHSYRSDGAVFNDNDLAASLQSYIDSHTADATPSNSQVEKKSGTSSTGDAVNATRQTARSHLETSSTAANRVKNPLSEYYDKKKSYTESKPHICNTLINSAWEHTHATIRNAHRGDIAAAKLHADLANSALKQAAHYLSDEEYKEIKTAILSELHTKG